ncbi:MAG TPA: hypothetical protein VG757_01865 [Devosia sp.]|nr:hypothetical protein [Devosia sp.]
MARKKLHHALHNPEEGEEIGAMIKAFDRKGIEIKRVSPHQLKSGKVNFWPSTGTIVIDGQSRSKYRGPNNFLMLADENRQRLEEITVYAS